MKWHASFDAHGNQFGFAITTAFLDPSPLPQQFCIGLVTRMIVDGQWGGVLVVAYIQTLIWWSNIGMRIDLHSSRTAPHIYAAVSALGVAGGAWFWSKI
jgi:hypothetical protein